MNSHFMILDQILTIHAFLLLPFLQMEQRFTGLFRASDLTQMGLFFLFQLTIKPYQEFIILDHSLMMD